MSIDLIPDALTYTLTLALIVLPPFLIGYVAFKAERRHDF